MACGESGGSTADGGSPDGFTGGCLRHADCDDGAFCTGVELCLPADPLADPQGCVVGTPPCAAGEACDEVARACIDGCLVGGDADGDGRDAIGCGGDDCDDTDPNRFPGNLEVCDPEGLDEDCDPRTFGSRDRDGDGQIDAACCNLDPEGGPSFCGTDCNDDRRDVRPGLPEVCDALDNDCDGTTDEGVVVEGFADEDRDLHGDPSRPISSCAGLPGFSPLSDDCDDANPARHRAQVEVCDGVDNDCDGVTDESPVSTTWYRDADDDGFGSAESGTQVACVPPDGFVLRLGDCDDSDRNISPLAPERCNGIDDDCNGRADFAGPDGNQEDDDGDGFADATCGGDDCDDASFDVNPGAPELEDVLDNDCDGTVDESPGSVTFWIDRDGDGFGDDASATVEATVRPAGRVARGGDCDDGDATVNPAVPDGCDGVDVDCDARVDEDAARIAYYPDLDGDGWGAGETAVLACAPPPGTAQQPFDCDDMNPDRNPGLDERCDGVDTDCDGTVDEASATPFFADDDGDGFGDPARPLAGCGPAGAAPNPDDCDDTLATISPDGVEDCNGVDDDCDLAVDEMADTACTDVAGGTGSCMAGECVVTCDAGRGDCNGTFDDGCEVSLGRDPAHCGGCFSACSPADSCGVARPGCDEARIVQLVAGDETVLARRVGGGLAVWGAGSAGAHGGGTVTNFLRPGSGVAPRLVHVSAGFASALGVTADRRVFAWGENRQGELGQGTATPSSLPSGVFVPGLSNVQHASMGRTHGCAVVREDVMGVTENRVYCWGADSNGALGPNGTFTGAQPPRLVTGITDAREVWCGNDVSCAILDDPLLGTRVQCWGRAGLLGDGTGGGSRTPVDVISLPSDVSTFAQGAGARACVLTASGRAYCWGRYPGDGSTSA
ncbi:MAG: MopE-related protein, partial [Myxococcota bacterium]